VCENQKSGAVTLPVYQRKAGRGSSERRFSEKIVKMTRVRWRESSPFKARQNAYAAPPPLLRVFLEEPPRTETASTDSQRPSLATRRDSSLADLWQRWSGSCSLDSSRDFSTAAMGSCKGAPRLPAVGVLLDARVGHCRTQVHKRCLRMKIIDPIAASAKQQWHCCSPNLSRVCYRLP